MHNSRINLTALCFDESRVGSRKGHPLGDALCRLPDLPYTLASCCATPCRTHRAAMRAFWFGASTVMPLLL